MIWAEDELQISVAVMAENSLGAVEEEEEVVVVLLVMKGRLREIRALWYNMLV
jgi:hypothetical protein